ncbi:MAG: FG-GAP-like repeat-containing protein [Pyrinomonadaceae bacterium]
MNYKLFENCLLTITIKLNSHRKFAAIWTLLTVLSLGTAAFGQRFSDWSTPVNAESIPGTSSELNTPFNDGCPIQSPDGLSLFIASNRPGGMGGQDIWIATRANRNAPWGAPQNPGAPINSSADDFCPNPVPGVGLYFVSSRVQAGACGGPDIYFTRFRNNVWGEPENLGCDINSAAGEASPSYFVDEGGHAILYFSSTRPGGFEPGGTDSDIYYSVDFGAAQLAPNLNTASDDSRPNVRKDGHEIVFDSNRAGTLGGNDIWTASRAATNSDWSAPFHFAAPLNSAASESRASLSFDGLTMVFGSTRPGSEPDANGVPSNDVYVTTREQLRTPTPTVADFDGDGRTDLSVFRPSDGTWYILQSGSNIFRAQPFGTSGDKIVPADYDGDGRTDFAVFRQVSTSGVWYILRSSDNSVTAVTWGFSTDKPAPGDYDGDGKSDIAVYRNGTWYIVQSSNGQFTTQQFGASGDIPVAAANAQ